MTGSGELECRMTGNGEPEYRMTGSCIAGSDGADDGVGGLIRDHGDGEDARM